MDATMWIIIGAVGMYFCCKIKDFFTSDCGKTAWRNWWGQY